MIEFLVFSACLSGQGCPEATSAYYGYNHDLQTWVKRTQDKANSRFGATNLAVLGTITGISTMRQGSFQIDRHIDLLLGDKNMIELHWETR